MTFDCRFGVILNFKEEFRTQLLDIETDIWPTEEQLLEIIFDDSYIDELKLLNRINVIQYRGDDKVFVERDDLLPFIKIRSGKIEFLSLEERRWVDDGEYLCDIQRWFNIKKMYIEQRKNN